MWYFDCFLTHDNWRMISLKQMVLFLQGLKHFLVETWIWGSVWPECRICPEKMTIGIDTHSGYRNRKLSFWYLKFQTPSHRQWENLWRILIMGSPVIRKLKKESDFKEPIGSVKNKLGGTRKEARKVIGILFE